jgi:hypothetical protein
MACIALKFVENTTDKPLALICGVCSGGESKNSLGVILAKKDNIKTA